MSGSEPLPEPNLTLTFDPPLKAGHLACSEMQLREPTGGEVRAAEMLLRPGVMPDTIRQYQLSLISKVSGVPQALIDQMPITRVLEAAEYLQRFVNASQSTSQS